VDTIINEAIKFHNKRGKKDEEFIADLDDRINKIKSSYL